MKIGMMWSDPSNLPLSTKISEAISYYQKKYGCIPNKIMVNPKDYQECNEFAIEKSKKVPKGNIWLGMSEKDNLLSELNGK